MPLTPGTSTVVELDPTAHYSTTKPGVESQTLNPNVGIEAGRTQTVPSGSGIKSKNASSLPQTIN